MQHRQKQWYASLEVYADLQQTHTVTVWAIGFWIQSVLSRLLGIPSVLLFGWGKLVWFRCCICIGFNKKILIIRYDSISNEWCGHHVGFNAILDESDTYYNMFHACTRVYMHMASDDWISLSSYLGSHMFALIPQMYLRYFNRWGDGLFQVWCKPGLPKNS